MNMLRYAMVLAFVVMSFFGSLRAASADGPTNASDYPPGPSAAGVASESAQKPDLKVSYVYVSGAYIYNQGRQVQIKISNMGGTTGKSFWVTIRKFDGTGSTIAPSILVNGMWGSDTIYLPVRYVPHNVQCIQVTVDDYKAVSESNENNNKAWACG